MRGNTISIARQHYQYRGALSGTPTRAGRRRKQEEEDFAVAITQNMSGITRVAYIA